MCEKFGVKDERLRKRLLDVLRKERRRERLWDEDLRRLWAMLETARNPPGLLFVKVREVEDGIFRRFQPRDREGGDRGGGGFRRRSREAPGVGGGGGGRGGGCEGASPGLSVFPEYMDSTLPPSRILPPGSGGGGARMFVLPSSWPVSGM